MSYIQCTGVVLGEANLAYEEGWKERTFFFYSRFARERALLSLCLFLFLLRTKSMADST